MSLDNKKYKHIKGWGVDAMPDDLSVSEKLDGHEMNWTRPILQGFNEEVLHSNERPNLTATFGTILSPSGLSGVIRRLAFNYRESKLQHWLLLLLPDRINVVEGIKSDLAEGYIPNVPAEKGYKAKWKYNKRGVFKDSIQALILVSLTLLIIKKRCSRKS